MFLTLDRPKPQFTSANLPERLVLVEGIEDRLVYDKLAWSEGYGDQVWFMDVIGKSQYKASLDVLLSLQDARKRLKVIALIRDSGEDFKKAFGQCCGALHAVGLPAPPKAGLIVDSPGVGPAVGILMVPEATKGGLETIVWSSLRGNARAQHASAFIGACEESEGAYTTTEQRDKGLCAVYLAGERPPVLLGQFAGSLPAADHAFDAVRAFLTAVATHQPGDP